MPGSYKYGRSVRTVAGGLGRPGGHEPASIERRTAAILVTAWGTGSVLEHGRFEGAAVLVNG